MTTRTTVSVIDQSTDAAFQAWVSEYINMLTSVGLVQTSDTGQINPATVTRAAVNTSAGYAIFRMNDSMQSSASIFFRFEFGSGSSNTNPRLLMFIGTGTNGAGTLTGGDSATQYTLSLNATPTNATTTRTSYACAVDGCAWLCWKLSGSGSTGILPMGFFMLARYTDSTGAPTAGGYTVIYSNSSTTIQSTRSWNFATSTGFTLTSSQSAIGLQTAWNVTTSLVSGQPQAYQMPYITPRVQPHNFVCCVLGSEASLGVQFQATLTGSTSRNYINGSQATNSTTSIALGLIWE
jgi:hypothetical protein